MNEEWTKERVQLAVNRREFYLKLQEAERDQGGMTDATTAAREAARGE